MSEYYRFDSRMTNEFYTLTEQEEKNVLERIHLAGHYRYHFSISVSILDKMKTFVFRNKYWKEDFYDGVFGFESDTLDDMYDKLLYFIEAIKNNFPILLFDNCESYGFFGGNAKERKRGTVKIADHVNNTEVELAWDDILKTYHLLKLFGLYDYDEDVEEQDEKEK